MSSTESTLVPGDVDSLAVNYITEAFESAEPEANTETPATTDQGVTEPSTTEQPTAEQIQAVEDSFTNKVDPNTLPLELQAIYKSMQGDYTRKMQEIAAVRQLGDPGELQQYISFVQNLQNDPQFAASVHAELGQLLTDRGLLQQEQPGIQQAAQQHAQPQQSQWSNDDDDFIGDPRIAAELEQLRTQQAQLGEWQQRMEQERLEAQYEGALSKQESIIRQQNTSYTDTDMQAIYQLAFSHGGDLLAAQQAYNDLQANWATQYLNQKQAVPSSFQNQPSGVGQAGEPVVPFEGLSDPRLEQAVAHYIANMESQG